MGTLLGIMIPLFGGMLIPVWIPLIAIGVGAVLDRVRPPQVTPAMAIVAEAKRRSAEARAAHLSAQRATAPVDLPRAA
jgi:hypothetical protein